MLYKYITKIKINILPNNNNQKTCSMKKNSFMLVVAMLASVSFMSCKELGTSERECLSKETDKISVTKIGKSEVSQGLLSYINNTKPDDIKVGLTRSGNPNEADSIVEEVSEILDVESIYEFHDSGRNLTMQAGVSNLNPNVILGAYFSDIDPSNAIILQVEQLQENKFVIKDKDNNPILEMTTDPNEDIATCTQVYSQKGVYSYLCNGAMAVLGWQVSTILAVPTGGASAVGFVVLWAVISTSYCR